MISPTPSYPLRAARRAPLIFAGGRILVGLFLSAATSSAWATLEIAKVQGPLSCGECHKSEVEAWKATHHFETFNTMHRTPKAKEIATNLGIKRIKSEAICLDCHYTSTLNEGKSAVSSGISCESCHGAARDWIKVHSDFGGSGAKKDTETPAHRTERIAASIAAGQIRPTDT